MMWATHIIFGLLFFVLARHFVGGALLIGLAVCLLGALFPDIDHYKSAIGRRTPIISFLINKLLNHRGLVHSILGMIFFFGAALVLSGALHFDKAYAVWFVIGYASHLVADSLNPMGVAWLMPFSGKKARGPITTNTWAEAVVFVVTAVLVVVAFIKL